MTKSNQATLKTVFTSKMIRMKTGQPIVVFWTFIEFKKKGEYTFTTILN